MNGKSTGPFEHASVQESSPDVQEARASLSQPEMPRCSFWDYKALSRKELRQTTTSASHDQEQAHGRASRAFQPASVAGGSTGGRRTASLRGSPPAGAAPAPAAAIVAEAAVLEPLRGPPLRGPALALMRLPPPPAACDGRDKLSAHNTALQGCTAAITADRQWQRQINSACNNRTHEGSSYCS
jgi:hypothetical protein